MQLVPSAPADHAALTIRGLSKSFGATEALRAVDLDLPQGEILALLGQNGAGKSTLVKILAGVVRADSGEVRLNGAAYDLERNRQAIAFIHQDLGLIEWMTVAENIALAQGYARRWGLIDWTAIEAAARHSLERIAPGIDPRRRIGDLTRTEKSLVAIARALGVNASILVLDEPTASLPQDDVAVLFEVLRGLKRRGVSMIYVSHRLDEVFAISDRLLVLRDGRAVEARPTRDANPEDLVRAIIGRPPEKLFVRPPAPPSEPESEPVLVCDGLVIGAIGPVSFIVRHGEVLGLVGLRGAGHEIISRALIGAEARSAGDITIKGRRLDNSTIHQAVKGGLGFVAADRIAESIAPSLSIRENMFVNLQALGLGLFSWRLPSAEAASCVGSGRRIGLVPNAPDEFIECLSGGNQQKVVVARWMHIAPEVLILEDPTAGVDVGAKAEIYRLLAAELARGQAIVLVSTDFEEVAAICHRALVFRDGAIVDELDAEDLSTESITLAAAMAPAGSAARAAPLQAS